MELTVKEKEEAQIELMILENKKGEIDKRIDDIKRDLYYNSPVHKPYNEH